MIFLKDFSIDNQETKYLRSNNDNDFKIKIVDEGSKEIIKIRIPKAFAVSTSLVIAEQDMYDKLIYKHEFKLKLKNKESLQYIGKILKDQIDTDTKIDEETMFDLTQFGCIYGNSHIIEPSIKYLNQYTEDLPLDRKLLVLIYFQFFHINDQIFQTNNCQKLTSANYVIADLAREFYKICQEDVFIKWCENSDNLILLNEILKHKELHVVSEDSLLNFIIQIWKNCCQEKENNNNNFCFYELLSNVHFDYCSFTMANEFFDFFDPANGYTELTNEMKCILNFVKCRCIKPNTFSTRHSFIPGRHEMESLDIAHTFSKIDDPKYEYSQGIFNTLNQSQIVVIKPSSCYRGFEDKDVYGILNRKEFSTKFEKNSSITIILKKFPKFSINSYKIECNEDDIKGLKIEGQLSSTLQWETIVDKLNVDEKGFSTVNKKVPLVALRLTQTEDNKPLKIRFFDVYGNVYF